MQQKLFMLLNACLMTDEWLKLNDAISLHAAADIFKIAAGNKL